MIRGAIRLVTLAAIGATLGCADGGDPNRLTFWAMGSEGDAVRGVVPEFERRHAGVRVVVQQIPWSAAHEKLLTAFVGGTLPDAFQLGNTWIPELALLGALAPLDDWIERRRLPRHDYFPGILAANVIDDVTYALPWYVDTRVWFYRRGAARGAGLDPPPRTWDDWLTAAERLRGDDAFALFLPLAEWHSLVILAWQAGSPLLDDHDTRGAFRGAAFRRALSFYVELFRRRLAPSGGEAQLANLYQEFGSGRVAGFLSGPWNLGELARRMPAEARDDWAVAPLPSFDASYPGVSTAGGSSVAVAASSPRRELAWRFVEYLSEPSVQIEFYRRSGDLPARRSAWQIGGLRDDDDAAAFWRQLENVRGTPAIPEWERIASKIAHHAQRAVRAAAEIDEICADLDRDVDAILAKRRALRAAAVAREARG